MAPRARFIFFQTSTLKLDHDWRDAVTLDKGRSDSLPAIGCCKEE